MQVYYCGGINTYDTATVSKCARYNPADNTRSTVRTSFEPLYDMNRVMGQPEVT
jgi:hypothetical protein